MAGSTDYEKIQILKAGLGLSPAIAPSYWMGISTTAINHDGTGLTEISGHGYARQRILAWTPAAAIPFVGGISASANVTSFPNPTSAYPSFPYFPFLADASVGGNIRWLLPSFSGVSPPHPGSPLVISGVEIVGGPINNALADDFVIGAFNTLTGAAVYVPPTTLYIGLVGYSGTAVPNGGGDEPLSADPTLGGDATYARQAFSPGSDLTSVVTLASNSAHTDNANPFQWTIGSGTDVRSNPYEWAWENNYYPYVFLTSAPVFSSPPDPTEYLVQEYDLFSGVSNGGKAWFRWLNDFTFGIPFSGTHPYNPGDTGTILANCLPFEVS